MDRLIKNMDNFPISQTEGFEGQRLFRVPRSVMERMRGRPYTRDFLVTDLGYFPVAEGHRVERPEGAESWVLIVAEEGNGWVELTGKRFSLHRGQVALLPPDQSHAYGAGKNDPWRIYWFHFQGQGAEALLQWTPFSTLQPVLTSASTDSLRRCFRSILSTVERGYSEHTLLELSRSLITVLTLCHARSTGASTSKQRGNIERIMETMREHLDQPRSLGTYARQCGLSISRFSEAFRDHCGVSPMAYFTELRVQLACELLDTTDLQVSEIAEHLGFQDALYFSRLFRKHTGMPPTIYRKRGIR